MSLQYHFEMGFDADPPDIMEVVSKIPGHKPHEDGGLMGPDALVEINKYGDGPDDNEPVTDPELIHGVLPTSAFVFFPVDRARDPFTSSVIEVVTTVMQAFDGDCFLETSDNFPLLKRLDGKVFVNEEAWDDGPDKKVLARLPFPYTLKSESFLLTSQR